MGKIDLSDKEKIFRDSIGQKATVERDEVGFESAATINRMLCDLGLAAQKCDQSTMKLQYRGSAAVHIYTHEQLGLIQFVSQADPLLLYRCPEPLAARAFDDLLRRMQLTYGKVKGKLRSGF